MNSGWMFIRLKPRSERRLSADEVIQELRPKLSTVPGIRIFLQNPPPIQIGGYRTRSQYQFTLQSPDTEELYRYAPILEANVRSLPGLQDVNTDLLLEKPMVQVDFDRDKAATLGLTANQMETALSGAYSSGLISNIYTPTNTYPVILEVKPEYRGKVTYHDAEKEPADILLEGVIIKADEESQH